MNTVCRSVTRQAIDDTHCNPKSVWEKYGKPDLLTPVQVEEIKKTSKLTSEDCPFRTENGETKIALKISTNDVVLLTLEP